MKYHEQTLKMKLFEQRLDFDAQILFPSLLNLGRASGIPRSVMRERNKEIERERDFL